MLIVIVLTDVDVNDHQDADGNNDSGYYVNGVDGEDDNNSGDGGHDVSHHLHQQW